MSRKFYTLIVVVSILAALLTACGGGNDNNTVVPTPDCWVNAANQTLCRDAAGSIYEQQPTPEPTIAPTQAAPAGTDYCASETYNLAGCGIQKAQGNHSANMLKAGEDASKVLNGQR